MLDFQMTISKLMMPSYERMIWKDRQTDRNCERVKNEIFSANGFSMKVFFTLQLFKQSLSRHS